MAHPISLDSLNEASPTEFVARLADIFENAAWVAERACAARPFATIADLHASMMQAVRSAPHAEAELHSLPVIRTSAGKAARRRGDMAAASISPNRQAWGSIA